MKAAAMAFGFVLLGLAAMAGAQEHAPREVRYCSNCATVEAVTGPAAGPAAARFEVRVRMAKGGTATFRYENDPGLKVGMKVKVNQGVLVLDRN